MNIQGVQAMRPEAIEDRYISTGHLPPRQRTDAIVAEAFQRYRDNKEGAISETYPALQQVPAELFGVCVVGVGGATYVAGDAEIEFAMMSVAKPFVFALICELLGPELARERIGVNSTGLPFNSLTAVELSRDGRTNPMVNSGAIATTSLVPGATVDARWEFIHDGLSRFAGRRLALNEEVYVSTSETNYRNQSIASLLESYGRLDCEPSIAVDLYTRQSSLSVTAKDLAVMGATLADGGVNPLTKERVIEASVCRYVLAVMTTAGLYEMSGEWLYEVGLPAKSGIGGGLVTVSPGKGGLGTYAPRLDEAGNSVKGQLATSFLSRALGLDLFASLPAGRRGGAAVAQSE